MRQFNPDTRQFNTDTHNTHMVGDITYIRTWQGWRYLAGVMDLSTKEIVGYSLSQTLIVKRNDRPRKKLNYTTPARLMAEHMVAIAA